MALFFRRGAIYLILLVYSFLKEGIQKLKITEIIKDFRVKV